MASRIQPKIFLTPSIHAPARGSAAMRPENAARKRKGRPSPSERTKKKRNPSSASWVAATKASSPSTTGPTHGAATTPTSRPIAYAPAKPLRAPAFCMRAVGIWMS